jgi:intracellular sulfur oxidation DsrE/DsrF family protein
MKGKSMKLALSIVTAMALLGSAYAVAGPDDPSAFDGRQYAAQKAVYDFNFENPEDLRGALGTVRNHLKAIKEFGDPQNSHIVIVAHGNEVHALARLNRAAFAEVYDTIKELSSAGVKITLCRNAALARGYKVEDFYDLVTVIPSAVIEIPKWENDGYAYIYLNAYPRMQREEVASRHSKLRAN